jgi:hypothetical protein
MVAAHDAGTVINPMLLEEQIAGGIAQGIGMALNEEVKLRRGRTLNPGLMDYTLPTTLGFEVSAAQRNIAAGRVHVRAAPRGVCPLTW